MRFMIIVKATCGSEGVAIPTEALIAEMAGLPRGTRKGRRAARRIRSAAEREWLAHPL
jgi:hypothetical protein